MSDRNSESPFEKRQELKEAALIYLKTIADKAKEELGPKLMRVQTSQWMVRAGQARRQSQITERNTFDRVYLKFASTNLITKISLKDGNCRIFCTSLANPAMT